MKTLLTSIIEHNINYICDITFWSGSFHTHSIHLETTYLTHN